MTVALNTLSARSAVAQAAAPQWLKDWQQQGQDDFAALAWPTRKTEAWKYTPLKALLDVTWQKSTESTDEPGIRFENWNDIRIDLVNGQLQDLPTLPAGVSLRRLSDCSADEGLAFLARIDAERNGFVFDSLNQALLDQAYWLSVDAGVKVSAPIHLNYISQGVDAISNIQVLVDLGKESHLTLVETFSHGPSGRCFVNPNTALFVAELAQLTHYHLLLETGDIRHIGRVTATLEAYAALNAFHMAVGGQIKRKDIVVRHRGEGARLTLNGVYLPKGNELIDYHTVLEHEVPHCQSTETFRGILADKGHAVFNGPIHIHKLAQKSVAELQNRNLLLSDTAEINTKPELEIYADDVRCAHGATIAQLDKNLLFYFQARGITKEDAEMMLSFGFINELLDALDDEPVRLLLRPLLEALFATKVAALSGAAL